MIRVLIADDHPVFREGLRTLLAALPQVEVVGTTSDTDSAVAACLRERPDVVVMDLRMPGSGGVAATRDILRLAPDTRVLVLSMHAGEDLVRDALAAGARGSLLKDAAPEEIVRALTAVAANQVIFDPGVAATVLAVPPSGLAAVPFPHLTEREREVLERMARGQSNTAIAGRLGISVKTVQNHVSNVFLKLGVADRAQAITTARDAGIGQPP